MRTAPILASILLAVVAACGGPSPSASGGVPSPTTGGIIEEVRYTCGGPPGFVPSMLDQPAIAEREGHPSAAALRAALAAPGPDADFLPDAGWWLVARDEDRAEFLARRVGVEADPPFASVSFERNGAEWTIAGWGDCRPTILLDERLHLATWVLDDSVPAPGPDTTQVQAHVSERECTGATPMGARLQPPRITYTDTAVVVVFTVVPLEGDAFDCPGNPSQLVTFELTEPLGDRQLLDGAFFPPAEPLPDPL